MPIDNANECLDAAISRLNRVQFRLTGWHNAIINATRNADRISLANDADSLRLDLSVIHELLRDARGSLSNRENS